MNIPIPLLVAAVASLLYLGLIGAVVLGAFFYSRPWSPK